MSPFAWRKRPLGALALVGVVVAALCALVFSLQGAKRPAESISGSDVTVYYAYGSKLLDGAVPYRDFRLEYPPGALPMFVLPAAHVVAGGSTDGASWAPLNAAGRRYYDAFTLLVLLLAAAIVVLTVLTLRAVGRPGGSLLLSLAVVAASPLLLGELLPERFDVWPAALTAAALAASVYGLHRVGGVMLGLGAAAKIYPALLVPVLVIVVFRQRGAREALVTAGAAVGAAAAVVLPFAILSFSGTWESLRSQFRSGLQIESLASSVLVVTSHAAEHLGGLGLPPTSDYTTHGAGGGLIRIDLGGPGVGATKTVVSLLLATVLCVLWVGLLRSRRDPREDLLRYAAATVALVLAVGPVLSPQYLIWLIPLVPLVGRRRGTAAVLFFVLAAALTNVWIPDHYFEYQDGLGAGPAALLLARNLALLVTALVLVLPLRRINRLSRRAG